VNAQGARAAEKASTDAARAVALGGKILDGKIFEDKIFEDKIFEDKTMRPVPLRAGAALTVYYARGRGSPLTQATLRKVTENFATVTATPSVSRS
jgi:hypothetical protein